MVENVWEVLGAVTTILAFIFGFFIALKSKQVYQPILTFNNGLILLYDDVEKVMRKESISTLIYGTSIPRNSEVIFACPHIFMNNSKLPIHNITLQLEYPSKYFVQNDELEEENAIINEQEHTITTVKLMDFPTASRNHRETAVFNSKAQIRYTIPSLRPGEEIIAIDYMKFTNLGTFKAANNGNYAVSDRLVNELSKVKKLLDFCIIDIFIYSESCAPIFKRLKLLWFDTTSSKELFKVSHDSVLAFWGGKWLKPGIYQRNFKNTIKNKNLLIKENGEIIIPELKKLKELNNKYVFYEKPLDSERVTVILSMPPWNYYHLEDNIDTDGLILKSGFNGPIRPPIDTYKEYIKRIQIWNILKGKKR